MFRGEFVSCPICEKRKPERFCPAKAEKICAVCCGTGREVTFDCPPVCSSVSPPPPYKDGHQRPLPADPPLLDEKTPQDIVSPPQHLMPARAFSIAGFCAIQPAA